MNDMRLFPRNASRAFKQCRSVKVRHGVKHSLKHLFIEFFRVLEKRIRIWKNAFMANSNTACWSRSRSSNDMGEDGGRWKSMYRNRRRNGCRSWKINRR
jgi:hypothetical protein